MSCSVACCVLVVLRLEEGQEPFEQLYRMRRATADMEVDWYHAGHPADDCVASSKYATVYRAVADCDDPFGSGRCVIGPLQAWRIFLVTGPVTRSTSACRGEATKRNPNRSRS